MSPADYIEEAHRTVPENRLHTSKVDLGTLRLRLKRFVESGESLDELKKTLAYGKENPKLTPMWDHDESTIQLNHLHANVVHGIVGVATETSELVEALLEAMKTGKPIDEVNLKEEVGDCFWYLALIAKACGFSFEEAMQTNADKLRARFPDKFTQDRALRRDINAERKILEGNCTDG